MASPLIVQHSHEYPVSVERAFDTVMGVSLPEIFDQRYLAIPGIREIRGQVGAWDAVGQTRTIVLKDRGTMLERLTLVERPTRFGYQISDVTGPMKPLVSSADGLWTFEAAGAGTRVTWQWTVHPRNAVAGLAMPVFARLWQGMARQGMTKLETLLRA